MFNKLVYLELFHTHCQERQIRRITALDQGKRCKSRFVWSQWCGKLSQKLKECDAFRVMQLSTSPIVRGAVFEKSAIPYRTMVPEIWLDGCAVETSTAFWSSQLKSVSVADSGGRVPVPVCSRVQAALMSAVEPMFQEKTGRRSTLVVFVLVQRPPTMRFCLTEIRGRRE